MGGMKLADSRAQNLRGARADWAVYYRTVIIFHRERLGAHSIWC